MQADNNDTADISLTFLVIALTFSHSMAAMSMMVLPAVAPLVAREFGVDPSLVGYQISVVSVGQAFATRGGGAHSVSRASAVSGRGRPF
jgi:predicted MFS family arabinose efflux permease